MQCLLEVLRVGRTLLGEDIACFDETAGPEFVQNASWTRPVDRDWLATMTRIIEKYF